MTKIKVTLVFKYLHKYITKIKISMEIETSQFNFRRACGSCYFAHTFHAKSVVCAMVFKLWSFQIAILPCCYSESTFEVHMYEKFIKFYEKNSFGREALLILSFLTFMNLFGKEKKLMHPFSKQNVLSPLIKNRLFSCCESISNPKYQPNPSFS